MAGAPAIRSTSLAPREAAVCRSLSSEAVDSATRPGACFWLGAARFNSATILDSSLSYSPMAKLLLFSDIHNDWKTLERILGVEADYYIAAGDQVSWSRGLDRCGEVLKTRGDKVWVLPGNRETEAQIAEMCERCGPHPLDGWQFAVGEWQI